MTKMMGWLLGGSVIVVVGLLAVWLWRPPKPKQGGCSFQGWNRTVGVELDAQVKDLDAIKSKIGISDAEVRDYDTLMKDYALKYDAACNDVTMGTISKGEYSCVRRNMDKVLNEIRQFSTAVTAAKEIADAGAQKQIIMTALRDLRAASAADYRSNCASAMDVNPKELRFTGDIPELSIQITNIGNNPFNYSVSELPNCLDPKPASGRVEVGGNVSVVILRTLLPVSENQINFHVHTNLQDDAVVSILIDAQNASIWQHWADQIKNQAGSRTTSVQIALDVINSSLGTKSRIPESDRYVFAANALYHVNENAAAQQALEIARKKDPALSSLSSNLILAGLLANRQGQPDKALEFLKEAKQSAPASDADRSASGLVIGSILLGQGNAADAKAQLSDPRVRIEARRNLNLADFAIDNACSQKGNGCVAMVGKNLNSMIKGEMF